jgi:DNA-binding SARP family transcriptional activator
LGPLLAVDDAGREVAVAASRQRTLLAALALRANQVVPGEELIELVWDGAPTPGAGETLRSHVRRLREALGPGWAARIVARAPGYLCRVDEADVDALAFEALCRDAGAAVRERRWAQAMQAAVEALGLWRGAPLLDVSSQALRDGYVPRLEQLHTQVLEDHAEAGLALGRHGQLVQPLRELTARYPLREHFHAQVMLALYRCGRRAEALDAYQRARRVLVEQLGIEPGAHLRCLHERILAGEQADPATPGSVEHPAPSAGVQLARPRQLPAAAGHFTGRSAELEWLTGLPGRADSAPGIGGGGTVVLSALDGMAGIGKTALAVHAAHRLCERFSDGQLFLDLHGYTQGYAPRTPGEALDALLRALGVPARQIPEDIEQRAALYRQRLIGTRTLIVLDNALDEAQVRPLLPAAPGCLVLITSRRRLKGLDDARSLSLDVLAPRDALTLLRAVAGADRVPDGDPWLGEVAELCGRLPLALRIAGALLRHRPAWTLEHLADLLRDQRRRITALSDGERDLTGVFDLSYTALNEQHRLLFRRLGLIPGPDADTYAAAALLDTEPTTATGLLEDLVDHNLLIEHALGRYRLHDLIRAHARTLAEQDPETDRDSAVDRLLRYYAHTAHSTSIPLARRRPCAPDTTAPTHSPALSGPDVARVWLRTERDNLEAAFAHARALALHEHTVALAAGLAQVLRTDGPFTRAVDLHRTAVESAEHRGDRAARATALTALGIAQYLAGDLPGALDTHTLALQAYRASGERHGEAAALTDLGVARYLSGDYPGAGKALSQALVIYRTTGDHQGEAEVLTDLGTLRRVTGDLPDAVQALSRALEICRATGDRDGEAAALSGLGNVWQMTGELAKAADAYTRALRIARQTGHRSGEANHLIDLGRLRQQTGDPDGVLNALTSALEITRAIGHRSNEACVLVELGRARQHSADLPAALDTLTHALQIFRMIGEHSNEAWALNHYASTVAAGGDLLRARTLYGQALAANRKLKQPAEEATALEGLGQCHLSAGDTQTATTHLRQALEIYQRLGMAHDTGRVQKHLTQLAAY